ACCAEIGPALAEGRQAGVAPLLCEIERAQGVPAPHLHDATVERDMLSVAGPLISSAGGVRDHLADFLDDVLNLPEAVELEEFRDGRVAVDDQPPLIQRHP